MKLVAYKTYNDKRLYFMALTATNMPLYSTNKIDAMALDVDTAKQFENIGFIIEQIEEEKE